MTQEPAESCEFEGYSTIYLVANTANSPYMTTDFRENKEHRVRQVVYSHASLLSCFI